MVLDKAEEEIEESAEYTGRNRERNELKRRGHGERTAEREQRAHTEQANKQAKEL